MHNTHRVRSRPIIRIRSLAVIQALPGRWSLPRAAAVCEDVHLGKIHRNASDITARLLRGCSDQVAALAGIRVMSAVTVMPATLIIPLSSLSSLQYLLTVTNL